MTEDIMDQRMPNMKTSTTKKCREQQHTVKPFSDERRNPAHTAKFVIASRLRIRRRSWHVLALAPDRTSSCRRMMQPISDWCATISRLLIQSDAHVHLLSSYRVTEVQSSSVLWII